MFHISDDQKMKKRPPYIFPTLVSDFIKLSQGYHYLQRCVLYWMQTINPLLIIILVNALQNINDKISIMKRRASTRVTDSVINQSNGALAINSTTSLRPNSGNYTCIIYGLIIFIKKARLRYSQRNTYYTLIFTWLEFLAHAWYEVVSM